MDFWMDMPIIELMEWHNTASEMVKETVEEEAGQSGLK